MTQAAAPPGSGPSSRNDETAPQSPSPPPVRWPQCRRTQRGMAWLKYPAGPAVLSYPRETPPYDLSQLHAAQPAPAQFHVSLLSAPLLLRTDGIPPYLCSFFHRHKAKIATQVL